jgi:hypothetical protein
MMVVIAVIGFAMFAVRWMFFASTVYSAGYDEGRFRQVRVGMTSEEVEELLGPPLKKVPWWQPGVSGQPVWGQPGDVNWLYTESRPGYSDYWMRNVLMRDGKVIQVQSAYWVEIDEGVPTVVEM